MSFMMLHRRSVPSVEIRYDDDKSQSGWEISVSQELQCCLKNNKIPTKYPTHCKDLKYTEKEDATSIAGVVIKQLEDVHPTLETTRHLFLITIFSIHLFILNVFTPIKWTQDLYSDLGDHDELREEAYKAEKKK